ncbi:type II toxin-antitoxin system ParD family antitoxin [Candidatus Nanohalobium constans]|uniref:Antitoxin ParD1/3/4 n=1 Tax=Candidatus Nanohalobium constans TaxID=2565781 RepID=A0A5Q0UIM3_9ARCH|nr:type II toxin-antitoxin system ParD family antitoxin [Candidatus Nanohalobium constans]QGA80785.1 antitoxin ParD1/3/4 [Candidatus Nanohalobium constans]
MAVSTELPEELERFVEEEVERGRYNSKSELLRDALRLKMVEREFDTRGIEGRIGEKLEDVLKDVNVEDAES